MGNVQQQHAAGVAHFGGELASQAAADFVFRQQHLPGLLKMSRLVVPQPEDFRRGKAGQGGVSDQLDQIRPAADAASPSPRIRRQFAGRSRGSPGE